LRKATFERTPFVRSGPERENSERERKKDGLWFEVKFRSGITESKGCQLFLQILSDLHTNKNPGACTIKHFTAEIY
jgi:hypothetical protein